MAYLRALALCLVVIGFLALGLPLLRIGRSLGPSGGSNFSIWFCRAMCALLRIRRTERGLLALIHPTLIVSNHVSWTDALVLGAGRPLRFLAKKEVGSWPILGAFARAQGCVFVDRKRRMLIPEVNRRMADCLVLGLPIVLFAEATTSDGTRVLKFRSSHIGSAEDALHLRPSLDRVTLQPASIVYRNRSGLPLGRMGRAAVAWYGETAFLPSLWTLLTLGPLDCEIAFGAPIDFTRGADRKAMARQAEASVRSLVGASASGRDRFARPPSGMLSGRDAPDVR